MQHWVEEVVNRELEVLTLKQPDLASARPLRAYIKIHMRLQVVKFRLAVQGVNSRTLAAIRVREKGLSLTNQLQSYYKVSLRRLRCQGDKLLLEINRSERKVAKKA